MNKKAVIIGAGAAGLLCGGFAARRGLEVTIVEKNARAARKVMITGKGRCNVTNDCSPDDFIKNVRTNSRFMYGAINSFPSSEVMALFESLGVKLKTERGNRVFPVSDKAVEIVDALVKFAKSGGAKIVQGQAKEVLTQDRKVTGVLLEDGRVLPAQAVMIATGGLSYPLTGSTGDGYRMAEKLGHRVVPARPSLVPIVVKEPWCAQLMGLSLRNVTLSLKEQGKSKPIFSELGEMLFTHFGVSGPLVLSASAYMNGNPERYRLFIDLKPGLDEAQLDARLLRDFEGEKNKDFINSLSMLLPKKMIPVAVRLSGIDPQTKVNSITKKQRREFAALLKALPLTPKRFRPMEEAIITSGGVDVGQISPKTMESKLVEGLFFAGEVIDVDAFTGGFNLQVAFSTAYLAAQNM